MVARVLGGLGLALVLGGCEALLGTGFDENFPSSSPIAAYATGTATIAIAGGETIELEEVAAGSGVQSLFGSDVRWTGPSGWNVRLSGAGGDGNFDSSGGYLTFDRILDGQHWTSYDDSRCIVDVEVVDANAIRGTATCKGVAWYDALSTGFMPEERRELDEPKFDAEVTFEAVR